MTEEVEHILVVDDDAGLRELLTRYLKQRGYAVAAVPDGKAMHAYLDREPPDLIILDLMLPGEDGLSLARGMRAKGDLPIIILSARGEDVDRIVGLEVGADDYLAKPFNPRELLARIRAVLRRRQSGSKPTERPASDQDQYTFGPFRLDLATQCLYRDDEDLGLTSGEFTLMRIFTERPNRVLSRDTLIDLIRGYERTPFDRSIDVRVTRLRSKIEEDSKEPRYIRTVWGKGYLFTPQGEAK